MTDIMISVVLFSASFIGGMGKVVVGWLNAKEAGESFSKWKFWQTTITTFFISISVFVGFMELDIGFTPGSLFAMSLVLTAAGFFGADEAKKFIGGGFKGMTGK